MNPREFVRAVLRDDLTARQVVKDARRAGYAWSKATAPDFRWPRCRAVYAAVVELLALRAGENPPAWTKTVGAAPAPVFLMGKDSKTFRRFWQECAPEPLRKRNVFASPEYLDVL
jgi:hypothetical protein